MLDGLAHQPVVPGDVERAQTLDARIADVLELLPVRRVHVRLERSDARAIPVHAPHVAEPREVAGEMPALDERIRGEDSVEIVHPKRLRCGADGHLDVAEGAPVQALEATMSATVGK